LTKGIIIAGQCIFNVSQFVFALLNAVFFSYIITKKLFINSNRQTLQHDAYV